MTAGSDGPSNGKAGSLAIILEGDDLRIAAVSYSLPLARMLRPGAELSLRSVSLVEGEAGVGDLSAVVEFDTVCTEGEACSADYGDGCGAGTVGIPTS